MASQSSPYQHKNSLHTHHLFSSNLRRIDSLDVESNRVFGLSRLGSKAQMLTTAATLRLAYESIGVVYGDIGTSPLYVLSSTFSRGLGVDYKDDVIGVLSLIIYTLTLVPLIKYVCIVLKANDNGDGGTFALYSLICRHARVSLLPSQQVEDREISTYKLHLPSTQLKRAMFLKEALERSEAAKITLLTIALLGTCMVIGDGVLTPAISVLSAVSGIKQAAKHLTQDAVVGISICILIFLFSVQRFGTSKIGVMFAPAIISWFFLIGFIGCYNLITYGHTVVRALNPGEIYWYFRRRKKDAWISLGGIVLSITGTEAMFADLGHFSVASIRIAFSLVVYPCLVLSYAGQASYLVLHPDDVNEIFYRSVPSHLFWPMFTIAVAAAIIASQAMISATFTVVKQSMVLGCFPRVKVVHISSEVAGQVYIPEINWALMVACVLITAAFKTTNKLGNAYGIAVVGVMVVTTCFVGLIMNLIWQLPILIVLAFLVIFGFIDMYFSSVMYKFSEGGYISLSLAALLLLIMCVWYYVNHKKYYHEVQHKISIDTLSQLIQRTRRVPGIGLVYSELAQGIPAIFGHMIDNLAATHSMVVFVCVKILPMSNVMEEERFLARRVGPPSFHMYRCVARYGYMDFRQDDDNFEQKLLTYLTSFISVELEIAKEMMQQQPLKESRDECLADSEDRVNEVVTFEEILAMEREFELMNESTNSGVVYLLGRSKVKAHNNSSRVKKILVDYVYDFLRRNCRKGSVEMQVPYQRLLEVGMIYEI